MTDPTYAQLQKAAKKAGVNPFGRKKSELIAEVGHLVEEAAPAAAEPSVSRETPPDRTETRATDRDETTPRRQRIPLGVPRQKLHYRSRPGYVRRWINDTKTRLHAAEEAGYEHVTEEHDGRDVHVTRYVGTNEDGSPMVAHLMEIRQEFYDEDQAAKEARNAQVDQQIMRRIEPEGTGAEDRGAFYTPDEGRSMKTEVG